MNHFASYVLLALLCASLLAHERPGFSLALCVVWNGMTLGSDASYASLAVAKLLQVQLGV
jgi:hypothetical protein